MNHIELFAGCGGLTLGLESTGFELLLANELSPMASETFAYNFFKEDLSKPETLHHSNEKRKTKWLSSEFTTDQMDKRLKEDPRNYPELGKGISDVNVDDPIDLKGNLIVGSIIQLNQWLESNSKLSRALKEGFDGDGVDLVSGGPPCQSFSMAGMRQYKNARNTLPKEFADFVQHVEPRMALLENVTGILRPFDVDGKKVHAWYEVAKAFVAAGYVPLCLHVNAKDAGVAQNRPRFLMFLFRLDVCDKFLAIANASEKKLVEPSRKFYDQATANPSLEFGHLHCFDSKNSKDLELYESSFLKSLVAYRRKPYTVRDAIDDLNEVSPAKASKYVRDLKTYFGPLLANLKMQNQEHRKNTDLVIRRFKIYQNLSQVDERAIQREALGVLRGTSQTLSQEAFTALAKFKYLGENGKEFSFKKGELERMVEYFESHETKKRTQKALDATSPGPAALSIPDDACHYSALRTLSVREMARIQSFPDNFAFRSKVTTGGQMRKFQVPQYTQVGNAVPPILGRAIGNAIGEVLSRIKTLPNPSTTMLKKANRTEVEVA